MKYKFLHIMLFIMPAFIYGDEGEPQSNLPGITEHNGKLYINSPPGQVLNIKATDLPYWASTELVTVGAMAVCVGPPDIIVIGDQNVIFGGLPVARLGDKTAHGGSIVVGSKKIFINGVPAAFVGAHHVCPMVTGTVPHVGGPIVDQGPKDIDYATPQKLTTPSLINSTPTQAQGILNEVGLALNVKWGKQATERGQVGKIYQQLPKEGQTIKPGGIINAWVYYTEVPAVVETPVDKAMPEITAAWFKPHKGKEIEVENEAKWNKVAAQSLQAGKKEFQVGLPVTLDVYVKPKKKESNSHPLVGQWEGFSKQAKLPQKPVFWNIISVSPSGKFTVVSTDHAGKKEKFQGQLKGNQINLTDTQGALKLVINATWSEKPKTIEGTIVPYHNGKNMLAGTGFSIIFYLEKKGVANTSTNKVKNH